VCANLFRELREPVAQNFVVVATECVARHIAALGIGQHVVGIACLRRQIVHARRDDTQRSRNHFLGPRAPAAMPLHVVHRAVAALFQPAHQPLFVRSDLDAGNADLLEAELAAPLTDRACQLLERSIGRFVAHARGSIRFGRLRP